MRRNNQKLENIRLKKMASFVKGKDVLDVAFHSNPNKFLKQYNTTGIDTSDEKQPDFYKRCIKDDATKIDEIFGQGSFDTIILGEFIEHVENPSDMIRKCYFVLRNNGRIILSTPNPLGFPIIFAEYLSLKNNFFEIEHKAIYSKRWIIRLLNNAKFQNISTYSTGFWVPKGFEFLYIPSPVQLSKSIIYSADKIEN